MDCNRQFLSFDLTSKNILEIFNHGVSLITGGKMPKIFEWNGYRFFFFSNEGVPLESCHIHVRKGGNIAKYWVVPHVLLDSSWGMSSKELNDIERKVLENRDLIVEKWNEFFNR